MPNTPISSDQAQMTDIHDIRPLRSPGPNPWLLYALPSAVLAVIVLSLWLYRQRKNAIAAENTPAPDPPHVIAMRELDALARFEEMDGRRFYFRLSAILRGYLAGRFNLAAPEMTIEELLPAIGRLKLDQPLHQSLARLLHRAEPIKFAGRPADNNDMRSDLSFARDFVKRTTAAERA
jgi:hypothetical protein